MPLVRVAEFGRAALNVDLEPTLLAPGEWTKLNNIDIESGDIRSAWGDSLVTDTPPVEPLYTFIFEGVSDTYLIISDGLSIHRFDGVNWADITPSSTATEDITWDDLTSDTTSWDELADTPWDDLQTGGTPVPFDGAVTFTVFLGTLVACTEGNQPVYWPGTTERMKPLPGWPAGWTAGSIFSYTNHLVVLGIWDGTTEGSKYRVAWSHSAEEGMLPQEWLSTAENSAGSVQLRDTDGYLVTAKVMRDDLIVYKNDSIYRMFSRGDEFVFGFERVISDHGCDSPRGVANLGDVHFFSDRGDLRIFDGQQTVSISSFKIKERLASAISNENRDATIVVAYPEREEVWVGVVPAGETYIEYVLVYNLLHKAWTLKFYPNTVSMTLGPFSATAKSSLTTWDSLSARGITWDEWEDSWDQSAFEPSEDGMLFGQVGAIYRADKTNSDYNGAAKTCIAERRGFLLADIDKSVTIKAVYPEMEGNGTVEISVGSQWLTGGNMTWTPYQDFRPGSDRKINVRVTGQPCGFRVRSQENNGWRLGALSFDVVPARHR